MPLKVRVKQERQLQQSKKSRAKNLTCKECNETFGNWAKLREHYESHEQSMKEDPNYKDDHKMTTSGGGELRRSKRKGRLSGGLRY